MLKQNTMQDIFCWFKDILFDTTIHSMLYCIVPEMFSFFIFYFQNTDWVTQCNQFHQSEFGKCGHVTCFTNVLIGQSVILCDVSGACDQY